MKHVQEKINRKGPQKEFWGTMETLAEEPKTTKPCQKQHSLREVGGKLRELYLG